MPGDPAGKKTEKSTETAFAGKVVYSYVCVGFTRRAIESVSLEEQKDILGLSQLKRKGLY